MIKSITVATILAFSGFTGTGRSEMTSLPTPRAHCCFRTLRLVMIIDFSTLMAYNGFALGSNMTSFMTVIT